jgi:putative transposase
MSLDDAEEKVDTWRYEYYHYRPYSSLNNQTPMECIDTCQSISRES